MKRRHFNLALTLALGSASWSTVAAQKTGPARKAQGPVLVVGDSLSAEYGIRRGSGWVALLQERLNAQKVPVQVVNAGISGDTTSGGRSRLPTLLTQHQPALVVIELGSNDALRGLSLAMTRDNLRAMVALSQQAGAEVLLVGMEMPPNYGARYTQEFRAMFEEVAKSQKVALVPFLLKGVADAPDAMSLFQSDRIHPNEKAQSILLDNVWPAVRQLLPS